jgi:hypothetical protein
MTNPHVLDQLPLWVEGDLPAKACAAVETHLAHCPSCQEAAQRLRNSQSWLREATASPFDASEREELRRSVMAQIHSARPAPAVPRLVARPALLAAGAAALLVAGLTWIQVRPTARQSPVPTPTEPRLAPADPVQPEPIPPPARSVQARPAAAQARPHGREETDRPVPGGLARLEFQLPDSNIRIIWLAQAKPFTDQTTVAQEAL